MTNKDVAAKYGVPKKTLFLHGCKISTNWQLLRSRCFKNVKQLPCRYRAQKKSWMAGVLFEEWVRKLDSSFRPQSKKVALLIDSCPAHPKIKNLMKINLIFLPPNTTSVLQPMDQGVIRSLKPITERKSFVFVSKQWIAKNRFHKLVFSKQWNTWYYHEMPYQRKPLLTVSRNLT